MYCLFWTLAGTRKKYSLKMFHKNEGKLIQSILKLICKENIRHTVIYKKPVKYSNVMKISEALHVAGGHLHTGKQCQLKWFRINTISGPFEFEKMVHESSYIGNML